MNAAERIKNTLNRKPVDQVPVDIWWTPEVRQSLQDHTGIQDELELFKDLGVDKIVWNFLGYQQDTFDPNDSEGIDSWGVPTFKVQSGKATYQEYGKGPLSEMEEIEELDDYPLWPDVNKFHYDAAYQQAKRIRSMDFASIGPWISIFEIYCHMRGMEEALMDVIAEPEFLNAALDKIENIQSKMLDRYLTELGGMTNIVFISDDMGTQESQLISTPAFCEHIKPRIKRWCEIIHRHDCKVLFHTDGAAEAFVPHLIECGVDILNPIQHLCPGMDRKELNEKYGDQIIFHGGIENQHVLPYGSVSDVKNEVKTCLETLGKDGGYIPSSCHNIQAGTPVENVLAMIDAVKEFRP
jgi:uroporphyrinogen decarboxylase